ARLNQLLPKVHGQWIAVAKAHQYNPASAIQASQDGFENLGFDARQGPPQVLLFTPKMALETLAIGAHRFGISYQGHALASQLPRMTLHGLKILEAEALEQATDRGLGNARQARQIGGAVHRQ